MKTVKFNLKKAFTIFAGIIFLAITSCTKDTLEQESVQDQTEHLMPDHQEDDLRQYQ